MIKALKQFTFKDRALQQLYQYLRDWAAQVTASVLLGGALVKASFPTANADVTVFHNLGSQSVACIPCALSGPGFIYLSPNAAASPSRSVVLRATAPVSNAWLYFFST